MVLFTHLKIILLQCFLFLVFNNKRYLNITVMCFLVFCLGFKIVTNVNALTVTYHLWNLLSLYLFMNFCVTRLVWKKILTKRLIRMCTTQVTLYAASEMTFKKTIAPEIERAIFFVFFFQSCVWLHAIITWSHPSKHSTSALFNCGLYLDFNKPIFSTPSPLTWMA